MVIPVSNSGKIYTNEINETTMKHAYTTIYKEKDLDRYQKWE